MKYQCILQHWWTLVKRRKIVKYVVWSYLYETFRINKSMETENRLAIVYSLEIWGRHIPLGDDEKIIKVKSWSYNSSSAPRPWTTQCVLCLPKTLHNAKARNNQRFHKTLHKISIMSVGKMAHWLKELAWQVWWLVFNSHITMEGKNRLHMMF